jgi:hypothetical protein
VANTERRYKPVCRGIDKVGYRPWVDDHTSFGREQAHGSNQTVPSRLTQESLLGAVALSSAALATRCSPGLDPHHAQSEG